MKKDTFIKVFDVCFKILLLIVLTCCCIALFSSCTSEQNPKIEEWSSNNLKKIKYEGHEYLIYERWYGSTPSTGITHSGNCTCNSNKNDTIQ